MVNAKRLCVSTSIVAACGLLLMLTACRNDSPSSSSGGKASGGAVLEPIGVPECDSWYPKANKCLSTKVPDGMRDTFARFLQQSRENMKTASKGMVGKMCKGELDSAKMMLAKYKCEW